MIGGYLNGKWSGKMPMHARPFNFHFERKKNISICDFCSPKANIEMNKLCTKKKNIACTIQVFKNLKLASEV